METICIFFDFLEDLLTSALNQINMIGMVIIIKTKRKGIHFILLMYAFV